MYFQSLDFICFFTVVLTIYWLLPWRAQNLFLIPASLFFYGYYHAWFLLPFAATTLVDYFVARGIESYPARAKALVTLSVTSNLALLCAFKYFNFLSANVASVLDLLHISVSPPVLDLVLPAGISFYTFQSIGYVVDVYRGHIPACRKFTDYALFVAFFPQLVAGPIQRAAHLMRQIMEPRRLSPSAAGHAFLLLMWGMFKKVVIADNVAITANKVFALRDPSFPLLWVGVLSFGVQIYADFSGYTDIARGVARLMGFDLTRNFNHPYLAQSPSDFWRRWHISLSTWIRDYIFIPLGGSRGTGARTLLNLAIVFFLAGLWHGAAWNFIFWGLYYAALTFVYRIAAAIVPEGLQVTPLAKPFRILFMFALTHVGWLIFREHNTAQLLRDFTLSPAAADAMQWQIAAYLGALTLLYASPLLLHVIWDVGVRPHWRTARPEHWAAWSSRAFVATALFCLILLLRSGSVQDFIYFQF